MVDGGSISAWELFAQLTLQRFGLTSLRTADEVHVQRRPWHQVEADSRPHLVYGFLTTDANAVVGPIHPKAMPVILTTDEEREVWMRARGTRRWRYSDRCRTMRSRSPCGEQIRRSVAALTSHD